MTASTITIDHNSTPAALTVQRLLDQGSRPSEPELLSFRDVASQVSNLRDLLDPRDIERPLSQGAARYDVSTGKLGFTFRGVGGEDVWESPMSFTRNGYRQMGHRVLGSGGATKFIGRQAERGDTGRSMAEINWAVELAAQGGEVTRLRTIQLPGEPVRSIRAALSQSYGCFDNADVLDALLQADGIDDLHVISAKVDEDAMRIRFLLDPSFAHLFDAGDKITREMLGQRIPMAELWNSETGHSSVNFVAGFWVPRCTNGMASFDAGSKWRWFHRGGSNGDYRQRITDGLQGAVQSARISASGIIEKHERASGIVVNDAAALLRSWGGSVSLTAGVRDAAIEALANDIAVEQPVAEDGSATLATVVDAVTWAAQSVGSLFAQRDIERSASRLLGRGLRAGRSGAITAEA